MIIDRLTSDKPLKRITYLGCYFFMLAVVVIHRQGYNFLKAALAVLLAISLIFLIARFVMVLRGGIENKDARVLRAIESLEPSLLPAGYFILLGLIVQPDVREAWIFYALGGLILLSGLIKIINSSRPQNPSAK